MTSKSTVVVAVVDAGGHLLNLTRMEGTPFVLTEVAVGKAYTANSFRRPTHELMGLFEQHSRWLMQRRHRAPAPALVSVPRTDPGRGVRRSGPAHDSGGTGGPRT